MLIGIKKNYKKNFYLASSYNMQPKIATYYSSKAKIFSYTFNIVEQFLYFGETKITI